MPAIADTIAPPVSKVTPPAPAAAEQVDPPAHVEQQVAVPAKDAKRKGALESIGERVEKAQRDEKESAAAAETEKTKKAEEHKAATAADPESDDALNDEIEKTAKDWEPGQKKAFTKKTYELRDIKRQNKELQTKAAEAETLRTKAAELERKLTEVQNTASTPDTKQIDTLKEEVKNLTQRAETAEQTAQAKEQELSVTAVERSDAFKKAVTAPKEVIENKVREIAKKYELPEKVVLAALNGTTEDQVDVAGPFNEADKIAFYTLATKIEDLNGVAETLRANAKESLGKMQSEREQQTAQQTAAQKEARASTHTQSWKALQEAVPLLTPAVGDDDATKNWNQHLVDADTFSQSDFSQLDMPSQTKVMQRASVFPMLVGAIGTYQAQLGERDGKIAEQAAEIATLRKSRPGGEITTRETLVNEETDAAKGDKDFVSRVGKKLAAAGL